MGASPSRTHGSGPEPFDACPDGGRCWHGCPLLAPSDKHPEGEGLPCWRVAHAEPFTGHNPDGDDWTEDEKTRHAPPTEKRDP